MPEPSTRDMQRLYDGLSRYQWLRRRLSRAKAGDGLEMHKTLAAPESMPSPGDRAKGGPAGGTAAVNRWLLEQFGEIDRWVQRQLAGSTGSGGI